MKDLKQFFATITGKIVGILVILGIGVFIGMHNWSSKSQLEQSQPVTIQPTSISIPPVTVTIPTPTPPVVPKQQPTQTHKKTVTVNQPAETSTPVIIPPQQPATTTETDTQAQAIAQTHQILQSLYNQLTNISDSITSTVNGYQSIAPENFYTTSVVAILNQASNTFEQYRFSAENLQTNFTNIPANYSQAIQNAINGAKCERDLTYMLMNDSKNHESVLNANVYLPDCASYRASLIAFLKTTTP